MTVSILLIGLGVWLDNQMVMEQHWLFLAFQLASVTGVVFGIAWMWSNLNNVFMRTLMILCALLVWRMSYFPIMVWAGWVATLGDWLMLQVNFLPAIVYPTFLLMIALMHGLAIIAGGTAVLRKNFVALPLLGAAFIIASMVSMTAKEDFSLSPDNSYTIEQNLPTVQLPRENSYLLAMETEDFNLAEQVLVFASGAMYAAIPSTPWSVAVKGTLEQAFRDKPKASSAQRVREHYLAFRSAQPRIRCCDEESSDATISIQVSEFKVTKVPPSSTRSGKTLPRDAVNASM